MFSSALRYLCTLAIAAFGLPWIHAATVLPTNAGLDTASRHFEKYVHQNQPCSNAVLHNARNQSAILEAAMPRYVVGVGRFGIKRFRDFASGVLRNQRQPQSCYDLNLGLDYALRTSIDREMRKELALADSLLTTEPTAPRDDCPASATGMRSSFERYLRAHAAMAMWHAVSAACASGVRPG